MLELVVAPVQGLELTQPQLRSEYYDALAGSLSA